MGRPRFGKIKLSGRPVTGRAVIESSPCVSVADLFADRILGYEWAWATGEVLILLFEVQGQQILLASIVDGQAAQQSSVMLAEIQTPLGGIDRMFRCPKCYKRRRGLYATRLDAAFRCRICHNIRFASQGRRLIACEPLRTAIPADE